MSDPTSVDHLADDAPSHPGSAGLHHVPDDHGEHDDHAHADEPLGSIDLRAWGAAILGVAIAAIMVASFAIATGAITLAA